MPPVLRAAIVDIRTDSPKETDRFLVDTNAWYWLLYPRASQTPSAPNSYQLFDYPAYLKKAVQAKSVLHCCALNYAELAHNIERAEREIYADQANKPIGTKEFRHDYVRQRARIVATIQDTWKDVLSFSTMLEMVVDAEFMSNAIGLFPLVGLDGYDLFMVEAARRQGVTQIVTDDGDYATVPNITVFTANITVIRAAQACGNLLCR